MGTNLYRHYKGKLYRLKGWAVHSETLEDVAVYECLYENPRGRDWVRPKDLFLGEVETSEGTRPRFELVTVEVEQANSLTEAHRGQLAPLIEQIFGQWDPVWFDSNVANHTRFHLGIARIDGRVAGFKLGYELDRWVFYSWLGGVLPEFRGCGVARTLMAAQHAWCAEQGYRKVQTKTQNRFRAMLLLNLKDGFEIIGTHTSDEGGLKLVLEKTLQKP